MLKALLGISVLVGIARGFFLINGYSEKPTLAKEPFVLTGLDSMSPMQVVQLILSLQIAYLLYVLTWNKFALNFIYLHGENNCNLTLLRTRAGPKKKGDPAMLFPCNGRS